MSNKSARAAAAMGSPHGTCGTGWTLKRPPLRRNSRRQHARHQELDGGQRKWVVVDAGIDHMPGGHSPRDHPGGHMLRYASHGDFVQGSRPRIPSIDLHRPRLEGNRKERRYQRIGRPIQQSRRQAMMLRQREKVSRRHAMCVDKLARAPLEDLEYRTFPYRIVFRDPAHPGYQRERAITQPAIHPARIAMSIDPRHEFLP